MEPVQGLGPTWLVLVLELELAARALVIEFDFCKFELQYDLNPNDNIRIEAW